MAFNLALLSDETPEELALSDDANNAVVAEIAEGPDADLAAMDDISGDLDDASATIEEGADTADTLEAVAEQVDLANKDGGLSAPAAEALRLCIEHMSARVGIAAPRSLAAEGFASKSSRVRSGQLAAEDIKGTAKQIWDWILKAYEKVKAWVIKWFNNFFDGATKVKNRAEKLKKAAEAKASAKVDAKDEKIVAPAYAIHLTQDGKPVVGRTIVNALSLSTSKIVDMDALETMFGFVSGALEAVGDAAKFDKGMGILYKTFEEFPVTNIKGYKVPENMVSRELAANRLGEQITVMLTPKKLDGESIGQIKYVTKSSGASASVINMDMVACQPDEVKAIAESVSGTAEELIQEKKDLEKLKKGFDSVTAAVKRASAASETDETKKRVKIVSKAAKAMLTLCTSGYSHNRSATLQTLNAALSYGAASLNLAKA